MESDTLPSASLVTLPRSDRSPRATWLITERRSVMLRCRDSFASCLLFAFDTRATARFRFSAIYPSSSSVETSARDFESPAANRSENSARCCTGERNELLNRHPTNTAVPSARNSAISTEPVVPLGKEPKSISDTPPDCRPALYASPSTANRTMLFRMTSVQIVELSRDFMPSSKTFSGWPRRTSAVPADSIFPVPEKPRASAPDSEPMPGGRHAATCQRNAAHFPALVRANPLHSLSKFRSLRRKQYPGAHLRAAHRHASRPQPHAWEASRSCAPRAWKYQQRNKPPP